MHSLVKGIILSVWIWFIIKVSEKVSGNTKHQIQNEFLYYFIWLWHSYGEISILGLLCAIGVQITDIVIAILCLFSDISSVCSLSNLFFRFHTTTLTEACSNELKQHHL